MIKLHYAKQKITLEEIPCIELKDTTELNLFLEGLIAQDEKDIVYLFSSDKNMDYENSDEHNVEILIESGIKTLKKLIGAYSNYDGCELHLQEFFTFEDAYNVALEMREMNEIAYDNPKEDDSYLDYLNEEGL